MKSSVAPGRAGAGRGSPPASTLTFTSSGNFNRDITCVTLARVIPSRRAMSARRIPPASISTAQTIAFLNASAAGGRARC
jgi:hypothetical protein